jgi:Zn-finger nucleic acid-binding protein
MRRLTACASCQRQYDASHLTPGERFRCHCGTPVVVSAARPREAAVVRCSGCGAPREGQAASCRFCLADFTLHDQDLETICPVCLARIGNRSRFCHDCGARIVLEGTAGAATDLPCPACGAERRLRARTIGRDETHALECNVCAGLWLAREVFETLLERARSSAAPAHAARPHGERPRPRGRRGPVIYRRCPVCAERMNRQNFGRQSGVVLDTCGHGVWFDAEELDSVLAWVRRGGEKRAEERADAERRAAAMRERFRIEPKTADPSSRLERGADAASWLRAAFELLVE